MALFYDKIAGMDFLKRLVERLPLEQISEVLGRIVFWWIRFVEGVPEASLAFYTYIGASLLVLILLWGLARLLPRVLDTIMGVVWIAAAAILLTPMINSDPSFDSSNAPAIIDVLHHLLMGEPTLAIQSFLPILAVMALLLALGALWQAIKIKVYQKRHQTQ